MSNNVKQFNMSLDDFKNLQTENPNKVYFLDFMADWCGPCKLVKPFINELADTCANNQDDITFYMVVSDDDKNEELVQQYNINALPTFMLFKNGETLSSILGVKKDDINKAVNAALGK